MASEEAAAARKERLRALTAAKELLDTPDEASEGVDNETTEENTPSLKFRNYLPHDQQLQEGKLPPPELAKFEDPVTEAPPKEKKDDDPFVNIAPKKPNWDLRRDIQKKLDKLERQTQKAMAKLMEERAREKEAEENDGIAV